MYILFDKDNPQDMNALSIGCNEYAPEFTFGVYLEDINQLKKEETIKENIFVKDSSGNQLYIDKNGVVSTNEIGKPLTEEKTYIQTYDYARYPEKFSLMDIMMLKKNLLLETGYDECLMYEFNLFKFMDIEESSNFDSGVNSITLRKDSVITLIPITFKKSYKKCVVNLHTLNDATLHYSFDNKNFKKGTAFNLKGDTLYLKIKNASNDTNVLYDYQLLLKE